MSKDYIIGIWDCTFYKMDEDDLTEIEEEKDE